MTALDFMHIPAVESALDGAAGLLNGIYLPPATPASVAVALAAISITIPCLLALRWLVRRFAVNAGSRRPLAGRMDDLSERLAVTEALLAHASCETDLLRQRVEQLVSRQESVSAANSRGGLRQAIALSKHGASTRHLIDTCGLSQGEAHLIQTLYGRAPGLEQPEELH